MRTLIWKEWREQRLFFFLAIGIIILSRIVPKLIPERITDYKLYALTMSYLILPIVFSLLLGALSFTNEFTRNTKSFILSQPVTTAKLFWVKYFSGLIILITLLLFTHLVFGVHYGEFQNTNLKDLWPTFYLLLPGIYSAGCFSSLLLKNTLPAVICTPFILIFGIFIIAPLLVVAVLISPNSYMFIFSVFSLIPAVFLILSFITWQKALVKDNNPLKTIFATTALILACALGIHAIANAVVTRKMHKTIQQAKSEGLKITMEEIAPPFPPSIPYNENAFLVYQETFILIDQLEDKYKTEWKYMPYDSTVKLEEITTEQKRTISRIMQDSDFVKLYALIEKAVDMPACQFYINYELSMSIVTDYFQPILAKMRSLARLMAARSYILTEEGKYDAALKSANTGLRLADSLTKEPIIITQLVRIAIDAVAINSYKLLLSASPERFDAEDYRNILEILNRKNKCLTVAIEGEPALFNGYRMELVYLNPLRKTGKPKSTPWRVYAGYVLKPMHMAESAFMMASTIKLVDFSKQPYYAIKASLNPWEKEINPKANTYEWKNVLARMTMAALSRSLGQQANYQATLDSFKLALALKIYQQKHANYPGSLTALAPEIIPEIPLDPFTGKDYIYRREGKGFMVYSIGRNEKDDDGILGSKNCDDISFKVTN